MEAFELVKSETQLAILVVSPCEYFVIRSKSETMLTSTGNDTHFLAL